MRTRTSRHRRAMAFAVRSATACVRASATSPRASGGRRAAPRRSTVAPATRRGVPEPADDDPTWRDRLGSLKSNGPDGPVGRRNRGPRRKIKQSVSSSPDSKPTANSNDARVAAWRAENPEDADVSARRRADASNLDSSSDTTRASSAWITGGEPETERYSFFGASTARYPAYATRTTETSYEDSPLDAAAIAASVELLAGVAGVDADAYGEKTEYATLARIALATHASGIGPSALRDRVADAMRSSVRAGAPPFLFDKNMPLLPDFVAAAADAARAAVPADAMREMTGAVAVDLAGWMFGPSSRVTEGGVTTVTIKKCRYLEATGCVGVCASMCKLPAQDVVFSEFGVPLHVEPDFATGRCRMHFGKTPPPESTDPALRAPCLEGCARSAQFARYGDSIDEKEEIEGDDRCAALPARSRA